MPTSAKVSKRYANSPKIKPKATGSTGPVTAGSAVQSTPGAAPVASTTTGTDGIPVSERHAAERQAMFDGHGAEMKDMHKRQAKAFDEMGTRHMTELGSPPAAKA